jgi:hypothetical protein
MKRKLSRILFISFILFFSCSKDKDETKPIITVNTPVHLQQIIGIDTIQVFANISDNKNIEWVQVSLRNNNDIPVLSTITRQPNTKDYELKISYFFDDIHLASGQYYFDISASDGVNITTEYVQILFDEVGKFRNGIFIFSNTGNVSDIYKLDNSYNANFYKSLNGDYLGSAVNSYDQQLLHTTSISGGISAINLNSGSTIWDVPITTSPPTPFYLGFIYNEQTVYIGERNGNIKGLNKYGLANYSAVSNLGCYMENALVHNDTYFVTEQQSIVGNSVKLVLYWMASGAQVQQITLNEDVKGIYSQTPNTIILLTNDASLMGKLIFYDIPSGSTSSPFSIGGGKIDDCIEVSNGIYLVAQGGDVTLINANNFTTLPYLTGVGANKLKYDFLTNELFVINGNSLEIYDYSSKVLKGNYIHPNNVLNVAFWYNK